MSKNRDIIESSNHQDKVEKYHRLFESGLNLIHNDQLPDKIILEILDEYSKKLDTLTINDLDAELLKDKKSIILLGAQEKLLEDNQQLISIKNGYEEVLNLLTHEFKNLLTTAQGYNLFLEKKLIAEDRQELLELHNSSDRVIKKLFYMVDSILKMSLNEKKLLKPDYRLIDFIADILDPLESELNHIFSTKSMQIKRRVQAKKTMLMADEQLLEIIVRNLLENAAKYGDHDSTVDIVVKNQRNGIVVSIKNFCKHLPDNISNNIFEKFNSVKISNIQAGTGIGLYNVKNLLRLHNGDVTCNAVTNKWIKFTFYLPYEPQKGSA